MIWKCSCELIFSIGGANCPVIALPVTIVILRPFMRAIPGELEDAATVDGATRIRFFVRILVGGLVGAIRG